MKRRRKVKEKRERRKTAPALEGKIFHNKKIINEEKKWKRND